MLTHEELELRGRLILWGAALHDCEMYLKLLNRAEPALGSSQFAISPERTAAFQSFLAEQPDRVHGSVKLSHINAFEALHPLPYPTFSDCYLTTTACKLLLVVLFCQLLSQGNRDEGRVARNSKAFVSLHLQKIAAIALGSESTQRFTAFCDSCIVARDKMIGHADGAAFEVTHGDVVTSHRLTITAVENVDFGYMASIVGPLGKAVHDYAFSGAA